jgi:UDP-N-acetylmuramoyl-tripeptide--D-alanyl-D-alanine ligase
MKNMTILQIAKACNGQIIGSFDVDKEAAGAVIDSRKLEQDYLFIATVGERVDGHDFINSSFDKGAIAAICERLPESPKGPCILVPNSFDALKSIAKWYRSQLDIHVVGITGSVGKTTTKEFISSVLEQKYNVLKTEGNFNNEVGLPLTILRIRAEHEIAVLEMGISDFGEMHRLSEMAQPDICVITNIGQCHLENLGSREGILKAKAEIFDYMNENGSVVINGDDDMLATILEVKGRKPIKFGIHSNNDVYATDIMTHGLFGSTCNILIQHDQIATNTVSNSLETIHTDVPLPGEHMILNALAATSVGTLLSMNKEEIVAGIRNVKPVGGRSNIIKHDKWTIIDDCYNANPVSMKAAIDLLNQANTKKVAILGDMFELGETQEALHKEVGEYAATEVDLLICVGKLSYHMYQGALEVKKNSSLPCQTIYYETREELLQNVLALITPKDTILVKASHGMKFEEVVHFLNK